MKRLRQATTEVQSQLLSYEITGWLAQAERFGDVRVVRQAFDDCDSALLREAARRLTEGAGVVALLATWQPRPQFVFAGSPGVPADVGELMRAACAAVGGRGGGRPEFAQGGAPEGAPVERALDVAVERLRTMTGKEV